MNKQLEQAAKVIALSKYPPADFSKLGPDQGGIDLSSALREIFKEGAQFGAQWQQEQTGWVKIEDEKPPYVEFVLCYSVKGGISYRCFSRTHEAYTTEQWINKVGITHWQRPAPPAEMDLKEKKI